MNVAVLMDRSLLSRRVVHIYFLGAFKQGGAYARIIVCYTSLIHEHGEYCCANGPIIVEQTYSVRIFFLMGF